MPVIRLRLPPLCLAASVVWRSPVRALVLADEGALPALRAAITTAGAPHGITTVGDDAVARFRFVEPLLV